jgi:hypothetical protein
MGHRRLLEWISLSALLTVLMFSGVVQAQTITGQIDGTIEDATGARVVGVTVTIINTDTKQTVRTLKTNSSGQYTASFLQIGNYKITIDEPGFMRQTITDIAVNVGDTLTRDIKLVPGNESAVTVTADADHPNTETNENSSLIGNTEIKELALNTRNFEQMILLQPGVSYGGPDELYTGQIDPTGSRNAHQLSINGLQPSQVGFLLDGADMLNHTSNGQVSVFPTIDAIQQIQTVRNNYGAQYGGGGSAITSIVTKAGGASYHGDAYFFFRHQDLDATPVFTLLKGLTKPPQKNNDFGFTIGGPVYIPGIYPRSRSKTFFFYSQEFKRLAVTTQTVNTGFPTAENTYGYFTSAACAGIATAATGNNCATRAVKDPSSPFPGYSYRICTSDSTYIDPADHTTPHPLPTCPIGAPLVDPVAQAYLQDVFRPSVYSQPRSDPAAPNSVLFVQSSKTSETQELARIDHQFSERVSAFFRFMNDPITQEIPNAIYKGAGFPGVSNTMVTSFGRDYIGHATWTARPNTVLEFGFSYLPYATYATPTGSAESANSPDVVNAGIKLPFANTTGRIPSLTLLASFWSAVGNFADVSSTLQGFENTTQTLGRHTLYFGANFEHMTDTANPGTNNSGSYQFTGIQNTDAASATTTLNTPQTFAQFLAGKATTFTQASTLTPPGGDVLETPHENLYELYIQDSWRTSARLTLNAGLRYSIFQAPGDFSANDASGNYPEGKLGGFQPEGYNPALAPSIGTDGNICTSNASSTCTNIPINTHASTLNGIVGGGGSPSPYGHSISRTPFLDLAPRAGFAWNVYGDGKTSLRGGYGIFYEQQPLATFQNAVAANPAYVANPVYSAPASFGNPAVLAAGTAAVQAIGGVARNWKQPYVQAWNLDVQQSIGKSDMLDVAYVGNNTVHLQGQEDLNQPLPYLYLSTGVTGCVGGVVSTTCYPTTGALTTKLNQIRPYLGWGPIEYYSTRFFADYSGLQASLLHRVGKKASIGLNYTWSKALANNGGPPNGNSGAQQFDPQNRFDLKPEWGPTLLDRRNMFTSNFVYQLPTHSAWHGFRGGVVNGWEVSGIISLIGGSWWTAFQATYDPAGQGGEATGSTAKTRPDLNHNPNSYVNKLKPSTVAGLGPEWFAHDIGTQAVPNANATWQQTPAVGHVGGNEKIGAILGPGYETYNLSVFKNFELPETMKLQFRVEAFNLPNHVNWQNIQTQTANAGFGTITSAYENRQLQLGLKLSF